MRRISRFLCANFGQGASSSLPPPPPPGPSSASLYSPSGSGPSSSSPAQLVLPYIPAKLTSISKIASTIPDDIMEDVVMPEGGLRKFLQRHPECFQVRQIANNFVASLVHILDAAPPNNSELPPAAASASSSGQQHSFDDKDLPNVRSVMRSQLPEQVRHLPSFMTPLAAYLTAMRDVEQALEQRRERAVEATTGEKENGAATKHSPMVNMDREAFLNEVAFGPDLRKFVDVMEFPAPVDIYVPSSAAAAVAVAVGEEEGNGNEVRQRVSAAAEASAAQGETSSEQSGEEEGEREGWVPIQETIFLRLHPMYHGRNFSPSTHQLESRLAPYRVPDYEVFRVARYLSARDYIPLERFREVVHEAGILQETQARPLELVLASDPARFELTETPRGMYAEILKDAPIVVCKNVQRGGGPRVGRASPEIEPSSPAGSSSLLVRFVFSPALQKEQENLPTLASLEEMGAALKAMPIKDRRRARQIKRYVQFHHSCPALLEPDVFGYYLFDLMPDAGFMELGKVQDLHLDENAKQCSPVDLTKFIVKNKHLFATFDGSGVNPMVQRADIPVPEEFANAHMKLTAEDAIIMVLNALPRFRDPDKGYTLNNFGFKMPLVVRKMIKREGSNLLLKRFPQFFEFREGVVDPRSGEEIFFLKGEAYESAKKEWEEKGSQSPKGRKLSKEALIEGRKISKELKTMLRM